MRGKLFFGVELQTRAYPFLTELNALFYKDNIKILPSPLILFELLTPLALAHFIMGDGAVRNNSIIICTDNFTIKEVVLIMNILLIKFGIQSSIHYDNSYPKIYIAKSSIAILIDLIAPYVIPSMQYKLSGLGK
jgi:hypothetical protein